MTYHLATRQNIISWQYYKLLPYFKLNYTVLDCSHSSGNPDKKSDSYAQILFADLTKSQEVELKELNFEVVVKPKRIKLT